MGAQVSEVVAEEVQTEDRVSMGVSGGGETPIALGKGASLAGETETKEEGEEEEEKEESRGELGGGKHGGIVVEAVVVKRVIDVERSMLEVDSL